jgi:aryl-alcohol dehydrogenase-like predicted oxidoreductase/histidinol phosphatase-like enzyme
MRLSTAPDRDRDAAISVLHAALDAGVTLFDTADAYCWTDEETGHNERLIADALASWRGDRSCLVLATKGGLTRPDGAWAADGRAKHLMAACEASCRALGVSRIPLYQLHAPDPRVPLATSVRALAALKKDGRIDRVGLCNVTVGQIEQARRVVPIDAVQVELSVRKDDAIAGGVVPYCLANGIRVLAYRPLGGTQQRARLSADPTLQRIAERHQATPSEIALAWVTDLSPLITPLPGPTRSDTVVSIARAAAIALTDEDRQELDDRFPHGRSGRAAARHPVSTAAVPAAGEIVMIMGLPGAGKSTLAATYVGRGYLRFNRDESGGSLKALIPRLEQATAMGHSRFVLDNTYITRKSRTPVIAAAGRLGLAVHGIWLATSIEDAQVNAVSRIVRRYGRLLTPEESKKIVKSDVAAFGPTAQFRCQRELESPDPSEGFSSLDTVPFARIRDASFDQRALIVWCDGILWRSRAGERTPRDPDDVELAGGARAVLQRFRDEGWIVLGMSWQPEIAEGQRSREDVEAAIRRLQSALDVPIDVDYCPHPAGPPICWCRKPLPGLGVAFVHRYRLDPARCLYVGDGSQDPGFARRLGFQYRQAETFFASDLQID